jgi:UDP:flavonoid glycosyltransferase YjiC (YdhE family)
LAYVGKHPSEGFIRLLREIRRPVKVYGPGRQGREGNLHFRPRSESGLLEDLAGCSWAVSGGGHTFISEALYLGKPVLSYPMARAFEQYLNAFYLERLGYGRRLARLAGGAAAIGAFEGNLERFREAIGRAELLGNRAAFRVIDGFIAAAPGRSAQWGSPASSPPALPGGG